MACLIKKHDLTLFEEPVIMKILSTPALFSESIDGITMMMSRLFRSIHFQTFTEENLDFKERGSSKILLVLPDAKSASEIKLSEALQQKIHEFCHQGVIKILGICAGAFYLAKNIEYQKEKVHHPRTFTLFDGTALGPIEPHEASGWKLSAQKIHLCTTKEEGFSTMLGGVFFVPSDAQSDSKPLAYIEKEGQQQAVAVATHKDIHGQWGAVLLGTHLEFESTSKGFYDLKQFFPFKRKEIEEIQENLKESKEFRLCAMHSFLAELGFK